MAGFIFGSKLYRVTAELVIARFEGAEGWKDAYVYKGGFLPSTTDPFQVEALLRDGAIEVLEGAHA